MTKHQTEYRPATPIVAAQTRTQAHHTAAVAAHRMAGRTVPAAALMVPAAVVALAHTVVAPARMATRAEVLVIYLVFLLDIQAAMVMDTGGISLCHGGSGIPAASATTRDSDSA